MSKSYKYKHWEIDYSDNELMISSREDCVVLKVRELEADDTLITFCLDYLNKIGFINKEVDN